MRAVTSQTSLPAVRPVGTVGLVVHGGRREAGEAARAAVARFADAGIKVVGCVGDGWHEGELPLREADQFAHGLDLVTVFGGDGTLLRAAYLARDPGVPLLGINLGRLGFLAELEETQLEAAIDDLARGAFEVEERMTLNVEVLDALGTSVGRSWALNEASVERTVPQRVIVLEVLVGETSFSRVPADAMIVATPTGSTAYAFSAGGPIVSPLVDAILLTPVAPHSLFNRTIVVDPAEPVSVRPVDGENLCAVSLDGRESIAVPRGGLVRVSRGEQPVRMVRLEYFDFYARVRQKFSL
jgi:NAD+ kinase